jgi:hypothetical protein
MHHTPPAFIIVSPAWIAICKAQVAQAQLHILLQIASGGKDKEVTKLPPQNR